jgi:hypothetical protein
MSKYVCTLIGIKPWSYNPPHFQTDLPFSFTRFHRLVIYLRYYVWVTDHRKLWLTIWRNSTPGIHGIAPSLLAYSRTSVKRLYPSLYIRTHNDPEGIRLRFHYLGCYVLISIALAIERILAALRLRGHQHVQRKVVII